MVAQGQVRLEHQTWMMMMMMFTYANYKRGC
jgi:hypothetical protein